eukprot:TRINITY_DN22900_c0_g1_i2.p1 TRINITY_DN22900_c0_g1~~TRINITY_DN22900_c0_g1_i2.p1  ORF type:complete len:339 (+),score=53.99 TRINITY_DN22900_c0_g1_i2:110-1126(+)
MVDSSGLRQPSAGGWQSQGDTWRRDATIGEAGEGDGAPLGAVETTGEANEDDLQVLRYCDFRDFVQHLGIDRRTDASGLVMVAAHHMFAAPLPPDWSEHVDESSARVYFFNALTGESLWIHPEEAMFRQIIEEVRSWRPNQPLSEIFEMSNAHLRKAYSEATEGMSAWSGPYDAPQGPEETGQSPEHGEATVQYYYNSQTGESRWADPRHSVEYDLRQRHTILCECMAAHTQNLAKMAKTGSSDEEDDRSPENIQAFVASLWESLGSGSLPLPRSAEAPSVSPPHSIRRPAYLPEGSDTVRSSMSYLTARSTQSCSTEEARAEALSGEPSIAPRHSVD